MARMKLSAFHPPKGLALPLILGAAVLLVSVSAWAIVTDFTNVANMHSPEAHHIQQATLNALAANEKFPEAFEIGDGLFGTAFNALDGSGANVGRGQRYTHVPRADLKGAGEWFNHTPVRGHGPHSPGC